MSVDDYKQMVDKEDEGVIAVDFDGVIHKGSKGFHDGTVYDVPVENVKKGLEVLSKHHKLLIYSCKANPKRVLVNGKTGVELIWDWLKKYELDHFITDVVHGKPNALLYIDDKGYRFENWNDTIKFIESFNA